MKLSDEQKLGIMQTVMRSTSSDDWRERYKEIVTTLEGDSPETVKQVETTRRPFSEYRKAVEDWGDVVKDHLSTRSKGDRRAKVDEILSGLTEGGLKEATEAAQKVLDSLGGGKGSLLGLNQRPAFVRDTQGYSAGLLRIRELGKQLDKAAVRIGRQRKVLKTLGQKYKSLKGSHAALITEEIKAEDMGEQANLWYKRYWRLSLGKLTPEDEKVLSEAVELLERASVVMFCGDTDDSLRSTIDAWLKNHKAAPLGEYGPENKVDRPIRGIKGMPCESLKPLLEDKRLRDRDAADKRHGDNIREEERYMELRDKRKRSKQEVEEFNKLLLAQFQGCLARWKREAKWEGDDE